KTANTMPQSLASFHLPRASLCPSLFCSSDFRRRCDLLLLSRPDLLVLLWLQIWGLAQLALRLELIARQPANQFEPRSRLCPDLIAEHGHLCIARKIHLRAVFIG